MNAMLSVRAAFDPLGLCNPGKIVPMLRGCGEAKAVALETPVTLGQGQYRNEVASGKSRNSTTTLASLIGEAHISSSNGTVSVAPANAEEISEILKLASHEGWNVLPAGNMLWLDRQKKTANLIINTSRLNQIIEHEPADLIAIAQAGVTLNDFNAKLAENGQWLPLDPPNDGRATLGGVVATGIGGPQQFGYGRPRGSVIGMKVVLADGSQIKAGGRVVKNVAGYDLCKLFTGSFGSLGIITELNFKLRPLPASEATVIATGTIDELRAGARAVVEARLFPVAVEIVSERLLVRFAGNEKGVLFQIEQARKLLKEADIVIHDADLWSNIAAERVREDRIPTEPTGSAKALMERIKKQLDPKNILAAD